MENGYDLKELTVELKSKGLDVAEDMAKVLVESMFIWLEKSAIASPNKYDDLLLAALPLVKGQIMAQVDKIDGKID